MAGLNRRRFLALGAGALAAAALPPAYAHFGELHWLEVVDRRLPVRGLPDALAGRTLVQLSDVHVGHRVDPAYVTRTFARVRSWNPDLVVFTGDFVTWRPGVLDAARRIYDGMPHGRLGTFGVLGNHDYGRAWAHPELAAQVAAVLEERGLTVLRNDVREAGGLQVGGIDDLWAGAFDAGAMFAKLDLARPAIVLSHNPDTADTPAWGAYRGWILSGHTHGGQVRLPPFAPPRLPVVNRRYAAGEVDLGDGRRLYVNRGVGHLLPFRFGVRPEVTRFTLEPAGA